MSLSSALNPTTSHATGLANATMVPSTSQSISAPINNIHVKVHIQDTAANPNPTAPETHTSTSVSNLGKGKGAKSGAKKWSASQTVGPRRTARNTTRVPGL